MLLVCCVCLFGSPLSASVALQVQRTVEALDSNGFTDIITLECLLRDYEVFDHNFTTDLLGDSSCGSRTDSRKRPREEDTGAAAPAATDAVAGTPAAANGHADGEAGTEDAAGKAEAAAAAEGGGGASMDSAEGGTSAPEVETEQQQQAAAPSVFAGGNATKPEAGSEATISREQGKQQQQQQRRAGRREAAAPAGGQQLVVTRPAHEARGHTGYLTFARKFVVMPEAGA